MFDNLDRPALLDRRGLVGMLARIGSIIIFPFAFPLLLLLYLLAMLFVALPYWLWTGEDLTDV